MSATESTDDRQHTLASGGKQLANLALARLVPLGAAGPSVDGVASAALSFIHDQYFSAVEHLLRAGFSTDHPLLADFARLTLTDIGLRDLGFPESTKLSVSVYNHDKSYKAPCANCGAEFTDFAGHDDQYDENQQAWTHVTTQECPSCGAHTRLVYTLNNVEVSENP